MVSVSDITGMKPDHRSFMPSNQLVLPTCSVGIEVEVERCHITGNKRQKVGGLWEIVPDGSLRNNGVEFVFSTPLFGADVVKALDTLCPLLNSWEVEVGERTSVHVHVDVRDMNADELYNLFIYYLLFERLLYKYAGEGRDKNVFCLPYHSADFHCHRAFEMLTNNGEQVRHLLNNFNKYSGLNLNSILHLGTIEFRHLAGTTDRNRILEWVNIIQSLKSVAMGRAIDITTLPNKMSMEGPEQFVHSVFGEYADSLIRCTPELEEDLYKGARSAQDAIYGSVYEDAVAKHIANPTTGISDKFREFLTKRGIPFHEAFNHYDQSAAMNQIHGIAVHEMTEDEKYRDRMRRRMQEMEFRVGGWRIMDDVEPHPVEDEEVEHPDDDDENEDDMEDFE